MENNILQIILTEFNVYGNNKTLVKATLSKPIHKDDLISISIRPVLIQNKYLFSWVYHYKTKDITKNKDLASSLQEITTMMKLFRNADLFTTDCNIHIKSSKKGKATKIIKPPTHKKTTSL